MWVIIPVVLIAALVFLFIALTACTALPENADAEPSSTAGARASDAGNGPESSDIDRAVEATLDAQARDDAEYAQRQTIAARVATARAPTPTLTPPGPPSLAG